MRWGSRLGKYVRGEHARGRVEGVQRCIAAELSS